MVDDEEFAGAFGRYEFQSKLFLNRGKDRWTDRIVRRPDLSIGDRSTWKEFRRGLVRAKFQMEIEPARYSSLVDHRSIHDSNQSPFRELIKTEAAIVHYSVRAPSRNSIATRLPNLGN